MTNKEIEAVVNRMYQHAQYAQRDEDYGKLMQYLEQIERRNCGLQQQVANMRERAEKMYRCI